MGLLVAAVPTPFLLVGGSRGAGRLQDGSVALCAGLGCHHLLRLLRLGILTARHQTPGGTVFDDIAGSTNGAGSRVGTSRPRMVNVLRRIIRTEGFFALYKGMAFPLLFASLQSAIIFQVHTAQAGDPVVTFICSAHNQLSLDFVQSYGFVLRAYEDQFRRKQRLASDSVYSFYDQHGRYLATPWQGFVAGCFAGLTQVRRAHTSGPHSFSATYDGVPHRFTSLSTSNSLPAVASVPPVVYITNWDSVS